MRVEAVTRTPAPSHRPVRVYGPDRIEQVLARADYVVSTLPTTPQTLGYFGPERFGQMQPHAWFINVGRGDVVDEHALDAALREKRIAGAYLDVFAREPLPEDSPLWTTPGLVVTPHAASWTDGKFDRSFQLFLCNLKRFAAGEALVNVIDPKDGY